MTRTKSSCSDERLPIGYSIRNFQPNRSNFLNRFSSVHFTSLQLYQEERGSTQWGGSRPPNPPRGDCADYTLIHSADVLKVMLNYCTRMYTYNVFFSCRRPSEKIFTENLTWTSSFEEFVIFKSIKLYDPSKNPADVLPRKS